MDNQPIVIPQQTIPNNRLLIGLGLVGGVVMAIFIVVAVLLGSSDYGGDVAQLSVHQSELAKIAEIGVDHDSATQTTKNFAKSVQSLSLSSISALKSVDGGSKISETIIREGIDSVSEPVLESAASRNNFNESFDEIITTKILATLALVGDLIDKVHDDEKEVLNTIQADFTELLSELNQTSS